MRRLLLALLLSCLGATGALAAGGIWSNASAPLIGVAPEITRGVSGSIATTGEVYRLRSLAISVGSSAVATGALGVVIRDGKPGTGTIIWSALLGAQASSASSLFLTGLDIRASAGSSLTVQFNSAGYTSGSIGTISVQGDQVPAGYSYGGP